jgi:hypothetical protein
VGSVPPFLLAESLQVESASNTDMSTSPTSLLGKDLAEENADDHEAHGLVTAVMNGVGRKYLITFDGSKDDPYLAWKHETVSGDDLIGSFDRFEEASRHVTKKVQEEIDQEYASRDSP